jgi:hypothetical protein
LSRPAEPAWRKIARLNGPQRAALANACTLLARARLDLARRGIRDILEELASPPPGPGLPAGQVELVGWAIATAAGRVPWRADCLIRAMAAARWLRRHDAGWNLSIGVRRAAGGKLEAHAWLTSGPAVVTGGLPDLDSFRPIPLDEFSKLEVPLN